MLRRADHPKIAKPSRALLAAAAAVVGASSLANSAQAVTTYNWTGSAGATWDQTGTNWSPAGATWAGANANVAQLGSGTATLGASVTLVGFTGDASSSITAGAGNTIRGLSGTSTFAGTIGAGVRLVWDSAGTVDLSGTNNDTSNQWVFRRSGTLRLSNANAWKTTSNAKIESASGESFTLELAAANQSFNTTNLYLGNSGSGAGQSVRFAAIGADRTVTWTGGTIGGSATTLSWNGGAGVGNLGEILGLGNANSTGTLIWASPIDLNGGSAAVTRKIDAINGSGGAIGGEISGLISDTGTVKAILEKTGVGTLILSANNTYTGVTTITSGILSVATLANGGVASAIGKSTNAAGNLAFNGGTLKYTGSGASTDRNFTIVSGGATIDASGGSNAALQFTSTGIISPDVGSRNGTTVTSDKKITGLSSTSDLFVGMTVTGAGIPAGATIASIDSASQVTLTASANNSAAGTNTMTFGLGTRTLSLTGASTGANSIAGVLQDSVNSGVLSVAKTGAGTWQLTGNSTYSGATTVSQGKLIVSGSLGGTSSVSVTGGELQVTGGIANSAAIGVDGKLSGTGTVGAVTIRTGGTLAPGVNGLGKLTATSFTLKTGSTLSETIGSSKDNYGQIAGAVTLESSVSLALSTGYNPSYTVTPGIALGGDFSNSDKIVLVLGGYTSGAFANVNTVSDPNYGSIKGFTDDQGHMWAVFYGQTSDSITNTSLGANDITLLAIPEPSTWAMMVGSMGMLILGGKFRRRVS